MAIAPVQSPRIDARLACYKLSVRPSRIHRFGVFAEERIPANRKVIEYTGQRISRREAKKRGEGDHIYLFTLDAYWTLDGAVGGSGAELINHSCEPNLISRIMKGHILYMSLRTIQAGEELLIDYHFAKDVDKVPCQCGAKSCRGTINLLK
jgi:uncharacterized protein